MSVQQYRVVVEMKDEVNSLSHSSMSGQKSNRAATNELCCNYLHRALLSGSMKVGDKRSIGPFTNESNDVITHHGYLQTQLQQELYWDSHHIFWPKFLADDHYDHCYFLEIFKTVLAGAGYREMILKHFFARRQLTYDHCDDCQGIESHLDHAKHVFKSAKGEKKRVLFSWKYPPLHDDHGDEVTHYTMLLIDPRDNRLLSFDSRGLDYAKTFDESWALCLTRLQALAAEQGYRWIDANYFDIQSLHEHDQFCQTWSLLLVIDYLTKEWRALVPVRPPFFAHTTLEVQRLEAAESIKLTHSLSDIITLWKYVIYQLQEVREAVYFELYCKTHNDQGDRNYNRYFSALESLANGGNDKYFPHGKKYDEAGYFFLEDFLAVLDERTLLRVLANAS